MGFFPVDRVTLQYLQLTGRSDDTVNIAFETEPIGTSKDGKKMSRQKLTIVQSSVLPDMFKGTYQAISKGNSMWNQLSVPSSTLYTWDPSTYIHEPPYFKNITMSPPGPHPVKDAYCLLNIGDV